jgi:hypothetical protein
MNFNPENKEKFKQQLQKTLMNIDLKKSNLEETKNIQATLNDTKILELREILKTKSIKAEDLLKEK